MKKKKIKKISRTYSDVNEDLIFLMFLYKDARYAFNLCFPSCYLICTWKQVIKIFAEE